MNNKIEKNETDIKPPEIADEKFWQDFSSELWVLFKKAENFEEIERESLVSSSSGEIGEPLPPNLKSNLRENCLSFARCAEIGKRDSVASNTENLHLKNCRFCERRVIKFAENFNNEDEEIVVKETWRDWFFRNVGNFRQSLSGLSPVPIGLAMLVIVLFGGFIFVLLQADLSDKKDITLANQNTAETPVSPITQPTNAQANADLPTTNVADTTSPILAAKNSPPRPKTSVNKPEKQTIEPTTSPMEKYTEILSAVPDLRGIPPTQREFVEIALNTSKIEEPKDVEELYRKDATRSGKEPKLLSPVREVIFETQPQFRWENVENAVEYQIVVFDNDGTKHGSAEKITENNWTVPEPLVPKRYLWEITARNKDGIVISETKRASQFIVVDRKEVENVRKANRSNLVKAIYFARVGLLDDAERELKAELKKNPGSKKAQSFLRQVQEWREKR